MLTLSQVKQRLKIDTDDDDENLQMLIDSAVSTFEQVTNRKLYASDTAIPDEVDNGINWDSSIMQGALILIAHWYAYPESSGDGKDLPKGTLWQWNRHRFRKLG